MTEATVTKEKVWEALKGVLDPEIQLSIVDLGMIYDIQVDSGDVHVKMTLTAPGCPLSRFIVQQAETTVSGVKGVKKTKVELVWDPPWTPDRITPEGRKALGIG
jgi:metal-sulfur cluster biosynthetic enzyme